ncbi:hypothetical protein ASZ90_018747 [hydrocarbon metagenome]|uniref:Hydrolase (Had superfamily) n=1 Tax=hydrocarbon metagenome TaxID=938273 RepID=A0A0W8E5A1_9ZZZZ
MPIKLVAIDLDDTLLDAGLNISGPCIRNIQAARQQGVIVTLATGRMYSSALNYALELNEDVPLITYQGALVKNSRTPKVMYYQPLAKDMAVETMEYFRKAGVHYHTYFDDRLCLESLNEEGAAYASLAGVKPVLLDSLTEACQSGQDALKVLAVIRDPDLLQDLECGLKRRYGDSLNITRSKPYYLEVMDPLANKAEALKLVAEYYGIQQEDVMAVGDSYNDLAMIKWAGIGVAMGNAREEVKAAADHVTSSNEEHGVAEALQRWVLEKGQRIT